MIDFERHAIRMCQRLRSALRSSATRLPDHYVYQSPIDLGRLNGRDLLTARKPGVAVASPVAERHFSRRAPAFIDDPAGTGMFRGLGVGNYASPPPFLYAVRNAQLVGYRTLLYGDSFSNDESILHDEVLIGYLDHFARDDSFANEATGLRRVADRTFRLDVNGRSTRHLRGPHIVLCSHEPANYGSLLFRVVPKLTLLSDPTFQDLPVVVHARSDNAVRLLELLGVRRERIVQHEPSIITHIDQAIVPGLRNPHAYLDTASLVQFQALAKRLSDGRTGRKIYVSRLAHAEHGGSTRVMLNEEELIDRLRSLDFDIVEPETLSMDEQIRVFASADLVVGPSGSAMFNVVFCRPGTMVVDIESEPNWIYAHAGLFSSCELRYGLFVGDGDPADDRPVHRRWTVNIPALLDRIEKLE